MLRSLALLMFGTVLAAAVAGQKTQTAEAMAAAGAFNGQEYSNAALGFSMLAPGGWSFYDAAKNHAAVVRNKQVASQTRDANIETSAANTQVLFQAIPPKFAGQDKQAILSAGIEKLTTQATTAQYATDQKTLALSISGVRITRDTYNVTYGGVSFSAFDVEGTRKDGTYRQRYLMAVRRGVAIFIVATFFDDRQSAIVDASQKTIKFK